MQQVRFWTSVTCHSNISDILLSSVTYLYEQNHIPGEHPGYFMHVSTASGQEGDSATLETKRMRLNRNCHIQCLQFYYFHSGNPSDVLNIWLRDFHDETDLTGYRRLVGQITGNVRVHVSFTILRRVTSVSEKI